MKLFLAALLLFVMPALAEGVPPQANGDLADNGCSFFVERPQKSAVRPTLLYFEGTRGGLLKNVMVLQTSGDPKQDEGLVSCVSRWNFNPVMPLGTLLVGQHRMAMDWVKDPKTGAQSLKRVPIPHICAQDYPPEAFKAKIGGTTTVRFFITAEGQVRSPAVANSSGNADLDAAALECVRYWRYRPATKDGKPVEVPWRAEIIWQPDASPAAEPAKP